MSVTVCRSCGAKVFWAITEKGKRMPLDFYPVAEGNIVVEVTTGRGSEPRAIYKSKEEIEALLRVQPWRVFYLSHFVTCPQRDKWRKKK